MAKAGATILMDLSYLHMIHEFEPCESHYGRWMMTVDYSKQKQIVSPAAITIPDMVSLLQQINTTFGMSYTLSSIPVRNKNQKQYIFLILLQSYINSSSICQNIVWREVGCLEIP